MKKLAATEAALLVLVLASIAFAIGVPAWKGQLKAKGWPEANLGSTAEEGSLVHEASENGGLRREELDEHVEAWGPEVGLSEGEIQSMKEESWMIVTGMGTH